MKQRLDQKLVSLGLAPTRSQAGSYIRTGAVRLNGAPVTRSEQLVAENDHIEMAGGEQYVSRGGLKLAAAANSLKLDFDGKTVLDVGSSTGGFTDFALRRGARKVIAVDAGSNQLHPSLRADKRVELHEQTDIRDFRTASPVDIVVCDVSFVSVREILPAVSKLCEPETRLAIMVKPQFEAASSGQKHKGIIKNDRVRRSILKEFERWAAGYFVILDKADSEVGGRHGNIERFYLLKVLK